MTRNVKVKFADGSEYTYMGVPSDVHPDAIEARAGSDFGKKVTELEALSGDSQPPASASIDVAPEQKAKNAAVEEKFRSSIDNPQETARSLGQAYSTGVDTGLRNIAGGAVRGGLGIGATARNAVSALTGNEPVDKSYLDRFIAQKMGADPGSAAYGGGKLASEIGLTYGAGPAVAGGLRMIPGMAKAAPGLLNAIETYGATTGNAVKGMLPYLANAGTRVLGGAIGGGAIAGAVNPENAPVGALIGGGVPAAGAVLAPPLKYLGEHVGNPLWNIVSREGPSNVLWRYIKNAVGEKNVPATIEAAKAFQEAIPPEPIGLGATTQGYKSTTSEALAGMPEASPLSAIQDMTARTKGGPSAVFGERLKQNASALAQARQAGVMTAMKGAAAVAAAAKGGVEAAPIQSTLTKLLDDTKIDADKGTRTVLKEFANEIDRVVSPDGKIDPVALNQFRMQLGSSLKKIAASENVAYDDVLLGGAQKQIQSAIDGEMSRALDRAGENPQAYKEYLNEYKQRMQAIRDVEARKALAEKPPQPTDLSGGQQMAVEQGLKFPNLLSRTAMMGNFILRHAGRRIEPEVDALATEVFTNPGRYAEFASKYSKPVQNKFLQLMGEANPLLRSAAVLGSSSRLNQGQ